MQDLSTLVIYAIAGSGIIMAARILFKILILISILRRAARAIAVTAALGSTGLLGSQAGVIEKLFGAEPAHAERKVHQP